MKLKESAYWLAALVVGLICCLFAALTGGYDDFRYAALVSIAFLNSYRIALIEEDHEPDEPQGFNRWDGGAE